ncbi:homoserine O-acetyltransferase [Demequina sp. TTPB684]|uniref:homoserine O-acetyltransferase MetX n=1 Tax=unclassified Demequina TaxID=2620311 RepID=UPI001CF368DB|nr:MULTISPECIES: homoserine O-acetyltransferase [unclassified Demequina]MCB2413141.1 homoserine O-acetyltransferase [Demequina sp. TTPB684]UPU87499.1 homoserine O-acetyltransferase [Demequina sp. TMPB413]
MDDDGIETDAWAADEGPAADAPLPASAAWREGDHPGRRQFLALGDLPLEADPMGTLPGATLAYETWGELNSAGDNAIYVAHALTGDSHVWGPSEPGHHTGGWWNAMVGPGRPIDPDRHFVVSANVIGGCQGSTGPASAHPDDGLPWGSRFPYVTIRDMVSAEIALADHLGIERWRLITGPSMGGMRAIEWAVTVPDRVGAIAPVGSAAATTADQIAWSTSQIAAVKADPKFRGGDYYDAADGDGPHVGLGIARMIAHTTYRSEDELGERFGRSFQGEGDPIGKGGLFAVQSYLEHHGRKLARRFDANTYIRLVQAIQSHDVGRGRGGVETALARYTGPALVVAVDSDRLYPLKNSQLLDRGLSGSSGVKVVHSPVGHDGFLVESGQLNAFIAEFESGL